MGIKQVDLVPLNPGGRTAATPPSKDRQATYWKLSRTDTVSSTKDVFPADTSVVNVVMFGAPVSNAGTTATVTVTLSNNTGAISTGTVNLLTSPTAGTVTVAMTSLPNLENLPLQGDLILSAVYAETGTASTLGGPWIFEVNFVR